MNDSIEERISAALRPTADGDFAAAAVDLLGELGYRSARTLAGQSGNAARFCAQFPAANPGTKSEQDFIAEAASVRILFQFTNAEIAGTAQRGLFDHGGGGFDTGNARSFVFAAVELRGGDYPRSRYAAFTRELNKRMTQPTLVLFRAQGGRTTLAFVHRRPNRHNPDRDVLGNVSLIRQIDAANPHRAHIDILADLSLDERIRWMEARDKPRNFDGLLDAWLDALDTEELNRRFYRDLFAWFERALKTAKFPADDKQTLPSAEEHVIRLITRLLFVWFIKEKGLAADELFIENQVAGLLRDYDRDGGDSYYRAALQNLFFATLNTEVDKRRFSDGTRSDHRNFSVYRYRSEIADPERLLDLFNRTPFINGGLFDCLDSFDAVRDGGMRVDCFTDNPNQRRGYSIPNRLFFGDDAAPGLIDLFNRYRFTVEENTPAEREVALDPELLGKVFENLLAAVNPETSLTARKETGSYYTPRPVVDYMVEEALVGALADKAMADDVDAVDWDRRLRYLLDYDDAFADVDDQFSAAQREGVVRAIAELKALDPAVGSGAFPMGILHKLTLALRRLDPDNAIWERVQREHARRRANEAFDTDNQAARDAELAEISDTFERYRDSDYGRKLYLIQNCIYGVDIQPIAAQLAKLRFFISLAIEQQPDYDGANYGIKPLPNLETRFVAADTLRGLERPAQRGLGQTDAVMRLERAIADNRERYFHANARQAKLERRRQDTRLRQALAAELRSAGFPAASARQIAEWEPFDQNAPAAEWFDAEYMFGVKEGFDVVIANPPYVRQEEIKPPAYKATLARQYADAAVKRSDLYCYFYARGLQLLRDGGRHIFVCSNSWLDVGYGAKLQKHLLDNADVRTIYESAVERQFSTAQINTIISVIVKRADSADLDPNAQTRFVRLLEAFETSTAPGGKRREIVRTRAELLAAGTDGSRFVGDKWGGKYLRAPDIYHHILGKYGDKLVRLGDIATVRRGFTTGANEFFYLNPEVIAQFGIEEEYFAPVMTSPTESRSLTVDPASLPRKLFLCHKDKSELKGTGALRYIEWGERKGYHKRSTTKSRARWYDLGKRDAPPIAMNRIIDARVNAFRMLGETYVSDTLQEVHADPRMVDALAAELNDDFAQVQYNIEGRANFGGGALELKIYETENVLIQNQNICAGGGGGVLASRRASAKRWRRL